MDTRVSSLNYIKIIIRLYNDIKLKSISKTYKHYESKGRLRNKMPHRGFEPVKQTISGHGVKKVQH